MILREATIKYAGYDPEDLAKFSHKRICKSCDMCGRVSWISKSGYKDICHPCSLIGNKQVLGMKHTNETKKILSEKLSGLKRSDKQKINYSNSKLSDKNPQYGLTGELSINYGVPKTLEARIKRSCQEQRIEIEDFVGFVGRHSKNRSYALVEENCIKMNDKFKGSHFHHITKSIGIYIPKELHRHIDHSLKSGKNMGKINALAIQYINGGLEI